MVNNSYQVNKKKDTAITIFIATIFVLALVGVFTLFHLMTTQIKSSEKITSEVAQQLSYNVHNRIVGDLQVLEMIASSIGYNVRNFKPKDLTAYLTTGGRQASFKAFSFIKLDGTAYTAVRDEGIKPVTNMAKMPCFKVAKAGATCFDRVQEVPTNGVETFRNVYAVPIYYNSKEVGVLSAVIRADVFKNILDINTFNQTAFSHIIKNNGDYVLRSDNPAVEDTANFFDQNIKFVNVKSDFVKQQIKDNNSGVYWTYLDGQFWLFAFTPVSYNNWQLLLFVPGKVLALSVVEIIFFTIGIMLAINCLLFLILKRIDMLQKKNYEEMMKLAFVDDITAGPNKAKFYIEAQKIIENISANDKYALVLMDITKFKVINEIYGFDIANTILKDLYEIIKKNLPADTLLARSFAANYLFIIKYEEESDINSIIDKIHQDIENFNNNVMPDLKSSQNNKVAAKLVPLFGVYLMNDVTVPINIMCDRVSLAKRTIVDDINKYISYYDDNLRKQLLSEKNIEDEMHNALAKGQFVMYLQPKYDMKSLTVVGSEALVRWIHPTKGFIAPNDFIPLFEKNGFVLNIDRYMWEQACKAIRSWIDRGYKPVPISVNVSRLHLSNEFFIDDLKDLIKKYQIPPELLELELTESAGFEDFEKFLEIVNELKKQGFSIAMDDFGSGYSSLNMLRQIPCDILKLDRGFINDSTTDERGKIVVQHILSMAKNLELKTVSEGIETVEQAQFLTDSGCDIAQGFLYAKPMSLEDFEIVAFKNKTVNIDGLDLHK